MILALTRIIFNDWASKCVEFTSNIYLDVEKLYFVKFASSNGLVLMSVRKL